LPFSLYFGPFQPFLEDKLLEEIRAFRSQDPLSPLTILVPNFLLVGHLRERLAASGDRFFNLDIHTLRHYLEDLTAGSLLRNDKTILPDVLGPWALKEITKKLFKKGSMFEGLEETPGFHRALRSTLGELNEGLFTPDRLKAIAAQTTKSRPRLSRKLLELSRATSAYEAWKAHGRLLDREDLGREALAVPVQETVWIYGLYDATALQRKVLSHLAGANGRWFVPYEDQPSFDYAKPFVDWLQTLGSVAGRGTWKAEGATALGRLQSRLFQGPDASDPGFPDPGKGGFDGSNLKVLLCPGEARESREIGRVVLGEIEKAGSPLSAGAVVLRETAPYRRVLSAALAAQGLPVGRDLPGPLLETEEGKTLLLMLDCFLSDFPRDKVLNFLASSLLVPEGLGVPEDEWNFSAWERISLDAQVVEGRDEWMDRLQTWINTHQERPNPEGDENPEDETLVAAQLRQVVRRLIDEAVKFDQAPGWAMKSECLDRSLGQILRDTKNRDEIRGILAFLGQLGETFPRDVEAEDFRSVLASTLEQRKAPRAEAVPGGLNLVDLMQARGVTYDVTVLPGLVERSVPRLVRQDPLLLDEERRFLNGLGAPKGEPSPWIPLKQDGTLEERLLFTLAVRSARKALVLTAPDLDPSQDSPRLPSAYLFEAAEAALGRRVSRLAEEAPSLVRKVGWNDGTRRDLGDCVDRVESVQQAFAAARRGHATEALVLARETPFYFEGCDLLRERQAMSVFTAYDGMVGGAEAKKILQEKFNPAAGAISASRLETYATCPLRYFYQYVLRLPAHREPDQGWALDPSDRGVLMHGVLENTLKRGAAEGWLEPPDIPAARTVLLQEIETTFSRFEKNGVTGAPGLWALEKKRMTGDLDRSLTDLLEDTEWRPLAFETSFGDPQDPESPRVTFAVGKVEVRVQGRVDRVDESRGGRDLRVVDYKTGAFRGPAKDSFKEGRKVQLPLYLWALGALYPDRKARLAFLDFMTRRGGYKRAKFEVERPEDLRQNLATVLDVLLTGVSQGAFPALGLDKACESCDYRRSCGVGMEGRAQKKRGDQALESFNRLGDLP